jgi:hypothetical protein
MKKVIDRKIYNTETATEIHHYWNGRGTSDFGNVSEWLYRTPKGAYFLHGKGGPMTQYGVPVGNNGRGGGEDIVLMTKGEAIEWLSAHDGEEAIEEHFGDMIEEG